MESKDIIKAMECCDKNPDLYCDKCPFKDKPEYCLKLSKYALDLIKNQQAEIEKQKKEAQILRDEIIKLQTKIEIVKTEAYTEFADRLKDKNRFVGILRQGDIDKLLTELTERKEDEGK